MALAVLLFLAGAGLARGLQMALSDPQGSKDFQWSGSRIILQHRNPYTEYQEYMQGLRERPFILTQGPNYPASGYVFLWPFAALDWPTAKVAWAVANVLFTIAIIAGLQRLWPLPDRRLIVIAASLLLISTSYRAILGVGQHALFSLSFFIWSLVWVDRSKLVAGLLLAVSWFKYTLTFPLTFILTSKKKYAVVLIAGAIHVLLLGFVSWWIQEQPQHLLLQPLAAAMLDTWGAYMDVFGLMERLGLHKSIAALSSIILLALTGLGSMFLRSKDELLTLSLLALISYVIFLHRWYDNVVFIFPLWYCMKDGLTQSIGKLFCGLLILAWYTSPLLALAQIVQQHVEAPFLLSWLNSGLYAITVTLLYGTLGYLIYLHIVERATYTRRPTAGRFE
jgi:hypothetical protein